MLNFFFFKSNQKLKQKKKFLCGSLQVKPICLKKLGVSLKHYKQFLTKKSISVYNEKVRKKLIKSISNIIVNQLNKNCFFIKIKNFQFFFKNSIYIISQAKFRTLIYRFLTIEGKKYRLEFLQNFLIYNKIIKHIFFLLKKKKNLFFSSLKFIVNNTILKTRVTHHNLFLKLKKKINYDRILLCSKFYQGNFKSKDIFKFLFFFVKRKKDILFEIQKVCRLFVAFEFTKECAHSFICYMRLFNINYLPKKFIIEIENSLIRRDLKIITTIFTLLACLSHRVKRIYFFALARVSFFDNRELLEFFILGALIRNINRFDFIQFMYILRKSILKLNYFFLSFTKNLKHISKLRCFIFFNFFFKKYFFLKMKKLHLFLSFNYYRLYNSSEFETNFFFFGHKFKLNKILFSNKIFITKYNRFFKNFSKKKKIVTHKETRYHKLFIINQKIISNLLGLIFLQKNRLTYSDCFISYLNKELRQVMINKFFFFFSTKILLYNFFFISYVEQYFNYIFLCFFFENEFFKKRQQLIILFNQFLKKEYLYKLSFLGFLFQKNNSLKCRSIFLNSLLNESWSFYKFMDHSPEIHGIKIRIKGRTTARARVKSFMFKRGEVFFQTFKYNLVQHQSVIKTRWGLGSISVWLFLTRFAAIRFNSKVIFKIKPSLCKF